MECIEQKLAYVKFNTKHLSKTKQTANSSPGYPVSVLTHWSSSPYSVGPSSAETIATNYLGYDSRTAVLQSL